MDVSDSIYHLSLVVCRNIPSRTGIRMTCDCSYIIATTDAALMGPPRDRYLAARRAAPEHARCPMDMDVAGNRRGGMIRAGKS